MNINYNYVNCKTYIIFLIIISWGKILSVKDGNGIVITDINNIGKLNSIRYRGYYYDSETELYYLQSRYYNPEWGRFINADGIVGQPGELLSANMFAYCSNNPINREGPSGYIWSFIKEFITQVSNTIYTLKPAYAFAGGCAIGDGPLPIGDLIGATITGAATIGAVGYAGYKTITSSR